MSFHVVLPRAGHLDAAVHVMDHVHQRYNSRLVFDIAYPDKNNSVVKKCDWSKFYRDAQVAIQVDMQNKQCKEVDICMFINSDHVREKVSHRSRSDFWI